LGEGVHGEIVPAAVIISVWPGRASKTAILPTGVPAKRPRSVRYRPAEGASLAELEAAALDPS
jgi:hypothetical protein